jgi:cytidylate kinase
MGTSAEAACSYEREPSQVPGKFPRTIAVDGSAASGKSTVGRRLAARLGYPFLDTGIMYRAVTHLALERGIAPDDAEALSRLASQTELDVQPEAPGAGEGAHILVNGTDLAPNLRRPDVEEAVSLVSRVPGVREALVQKQREIAARGPIVMAGRDIGTVVLPGAGAKIYLDASLEERAGRRHREFAALGRPVTEDEVLKDIRRRDRIDSERALSPLKPAEDAIRVTTDGMSLDEVVDTVIGLLERQRG